MFDHCVLCGNNEVVVSGDWGRGISFRCTRCGHTVFVPWDEVKIVWTGDMDKYEYPIKFDYQSWLKEMGIEKTV